MHAHIDTFIRFLGQLARMLDKIESCDDEFGSILSASLAPDMVPLVTQVRVSANFPCRALCKSVGKDVISFENSLDSYQGLKHQLRESIHFLEQMKPETNYRQEAVITDQAGQQEITLPITDYFRQFVLPNFFFHIAMVYAIARQQGVPLSKGDFDGLHFYPVGFSFN